MDIKMLASQIILISSMLCSSFSNGDVSSYNYQVYSYEVNWNDIYDVDESQLVAEIPSSKIKLYYVEEDKDVGIYRKRLISTCIESALDI